MPVRLLNKPNNDTIFKLANKYFLEMFVNKELTIQSYKEIYNTFEDIVHGLKPEIKESIILSNNENNESSLKERFEKIKVNEFLPSEFLKTDVEIFYYFVFGYLSQAIDIISVCSYFKLIPILENTVTYYYVNVLINNFANKDLENILFKISLAYILNNSFNYKIVDGICFKEYIEKIKKYEFFTILINSYKLLVKGNRVEENIFTMLQ